MTPGQLVKAVSIALDVTEETVTQHDRNLVVEGLRTTGARGRNAPSVTPLDAARLFVATLASIRTKDSADVVRAFEKTELTDWVDIYSKMGFPLEDAQSRERFADVAVVALPPKHNFVEAVASLISDASGPVDAREQYLERFSPMHIDCELPFVSANIGHFGTKWSRRYALPPKTSSNKSDQKRDEPAWVRYVGQYGILQRRETAGAALILLGRAFRENGLNFASTKEAILDFVKSTGRAPKKDVA